MHARPLLRMRLMSDCAWPGGDRCNDDHGGAVVCTREGGSGRQDRHRHAQAGHIADIIELRVWPPMAGLHSAADGLLARSGGSGCATVWHRCSATQARDHSVQVASGSGSASYRAGLAAMVEGRLRTRLRPARVAVRQSSERAGGCRGRHYPASQERCRRVLGVACAAVVPVKRVGAQDRVVAWRGICSVCRMNPVAADHLRAQRGLTRREGSQRLKESTAAPSWQHSQQCLLAAPVPKTRATRSA